MPRPAVPSTPVLGPSTGLLGLTIRDKLARMPSIRHDHIAIVRAWFGDRYLVDWIFQTGMYRATHRGTGDILEAATCEELWQLLRADSITRD